MYDELRIGKPKLSIKELSFEGIRYVRSENI